jgi:DNA mismatch repair protein MutS
MSIVQDYLDYTKKWKAEYGEKTLVLIQVGSFFEVYSLKNPDGTSSGSNIEEFASINDFIIAEKNTCVGKLPVLMAGFGVNQLDKYVRKMQEHDYTIVVYRQDVNGKNTTRSLAEIISPGTFFGQETQELSNNIMSIWLHKSNATKFSASNMTIGVANIDIFTGKTSLFQFIIEYNHNPLTYDELERYISAYKPSECLIISNIKETLVNDIISFVGLDTCRKIHKVNLCDTDTLTNDKTIQRSMITCALNAEKQKYQKEVLTRFYPTMSDSTLMESFPTHFIATQAFCFLLDFVYQHSPNLIRKLNTPLYENHTDKLVLANHSLRQLNIIDDSRHSGKLRSVSSLLNNCVTTMGKRSFMYNLYNPTTNVQTLNESYDITEHLLENETQWETIRKSLSTIKDIEKMCRKIVIGKIVPKDFALLAYDLRVISDLYNNLYEDDILTNYINKYTLNTSQNILENTSENTSENTLEKISNNININQICKNILCELETTFSLDKCFQMNEISINQLLDLEAEQLFFINKGISSTIDKLMYDSLDGREKLEAIRDYFSDIIKLSEKNTGKATQYIKIHETPKSDAVLLGTSRRIALLKTHLNKIKATTKTKNGISTTSFATESTNTVTITYNSKFTHKLETFELSIEDLSYETNGSNKSDLIITNSQIKAITSSLRESKDKLVQEIMLVFNKYVSEFLKFQKELEHIKNYITLLDLLQCKCYIARKYNYCKPKIVDINKEQKSFVDFTGIRHPLIEHLQLNELYVTNDLNIGSENSDMNGLLLYGTNAVGKTSFIKSVGIAIVMAQSGLYVPCSSFNYKPYSYIFTRILGNDNLFKGLSTFAVEMSELRTIITQANENSLVLGDELCSGTESDSALSIFTAGLEHLHQKESTFLFATHFHEIVKFDEIKALSKLKMKHMAVKYDKEHGELIYDRKLQDGAGDSMYGLEVCRSLNLPDDFLQRAHDIRMKYNKSVQNMLTLSESHFNSQKIISNCELCKIEKASEVHHLQHQKNAKKNNNYIDSFHKNHPANLLNICETCHQKIHSTTAQHKICKTTKGTYVLKEIQ